MLFNSFTYSDIPYSNKRRPLPIKRRIREKKVNKRPTC